MEAKSLEAAVGNMSLNDSDLPISSQSSHEFGNDLLPLDSLYKLCMRYYKENVSGGLSIPYQDKMKLLALHKQVTCGKYTPGAGQEPGFLDVVGNDRKQAWQALGELSKEDAMKDFIKLLYKCCPSVKEHVVTHMVQLEDQAKQRKLEEEKRREEEKEAERQREAAANGQQAQHLQEEQVRRVLNQQTEVQFRNYAQSQFPNDPAQQETLVKQLREQHFQQYVRQVYEAQLKQQSAQMPTLGLTAPAVSSQGVTPQASAPFAAAPGPQFQQQSVSSSGASSALTNPGATHNEQINGASDPPSQNEVTLQEANMWTQKDIASFKNAIKKESKMENHTDCIIKVGSGETVTIRVPTHENGNCLFWEFATDHYDIAFGTYFEWNNSPEDGIHLHVSDSSEDEEEPNSDDKEKGGGEDTKPRGPPIDEIIPIYRRDSHEEVYCGSHVYPGRGVYLLKFDNSYSLWRSKTLYYRVYYSR
ncbi:Golgi resident protein GCP60-like [Watersipora subatra]|uniref:Golgi resident protein GCP60-like n=1 Tax=Watersipora subatra TaxID=2589382 RepID=UPI00355C8C9C